MVFHPFGISRYIVPVLFIFYLAVLFIKQLTRLPIILIRQAQMGVCSNRDQLKSSNRNSKQSTESKPTQGNSETRISRKSTLGQKSPKINQQYQLKQALNRYFDHYDKDGDDHLTLDEIQQFLIEIGKVKVEGKGKAESKHSTSDLARIIMDKLDKDGDGTISRNQFYRFYKEVRNH